MPAFLYYFFLEAIKYTHWGLFDSVRACFSFMSICSLSQFLHMTEKWDSGAFPGTISKKHYLRPVFLPYLFHSRLLIIHLFTS